MRFGIVGLGLIGAYVGVHLAGAGHEVRAVGRRPLDSNDLLRMRAIDLKGRAVRNSGAMRYSTDSGCLRECDAVLVCVKSQATMAVAERLAATIGDLVPVISLQNGLANPGRLADVGLHTYGAVVTFNVRRGDSTDPSDPLGSDDFSQTTSGPLVIAARSHQRGIELDRSIVEVLRDAQLPTTVANDFDAAARAKLLLNLINGVCAATGLGVADGIINRDFRRVYAACIREGLACFALSEEAVGRLGPLAPALIARMLPLPDALVRVLARPMIQVDARARSSTLVDLEAGRSCEIDQLNGEIVRRSVALGLPCPANRTVLELVTEIEQQALSGNRLIHQSPARLWELCH